MRACRTWWSWDRGRTGWPPPSPAPRPAAPCSCSRPPTRSAAARAARSSPRPGFVHDVCSAIHPMAAVSPFFAHRRPRAPRPRARPPGDRARPPARRRPGRGHAPVDRGDRRRPRRGRQGVGPPRRLGGAPLGRPGAGDPRPARCACPATRSRWPASARGRCCPATVVRPRLLHRRGQGAVRRARPRTRSSRCRARSRPRRASCSSRPATSPAGRRRAAARRPSPTRWPSGWPSSAGRSRPGGSCGRSTTCRSRARCSSTSPRASCCASAATRSPTGYRSRLGRFRYGPGVFKVDYALSEPVPWTNPDARRAGSLHLGGTLRGDRGRRRPTWRPAATRAARSCSSRSRASSTPPGRPRASTRSGPTATCRRAPPST